MEKKIIDKFLSYLGKPTNNSISYHYLKGGKKSNVISLEIDDHKYVLKHFSTKQYKLRIEHYSIKQLFKRSIEAENIFNTIISDITPTIIYKDDENSVLVFEYLENYLRIVYKDPQLQCLAIAQLIGFLKCLHEKAPVIKYHSLGFRNISSDYLKRLKSVGNINNSLACFNDHEHNDIVKHIDNIYATDLLDEMQYIVENAQCSSIILGDFSFDNLMSNDRNISIVDLELFGLGPKSFDIGRILSQYSFYFIVGKISRTTFLKSLLRLTSSVEQLDYDQKEIIRFFMFMTLSYLLGSNGKRYSSCGVDEFINLLNWIAIQFRKPMNLRKTIQEYGES
jgi:thiamine kinase-like enzyme